MKKKNQKDQLYLYEKGIPKSKLAMIERAINKGTDLAREKLGVKLPVTVHFGIAKLEKSEWSLGRTGKKFIDIRVTKKYLLSRQASSELVSTMIHEYVHYLRLNNGRHQAKTVLSSAIEEGIAIFMETALSSPKQYLDIKTLNEKMVRLCISKLSLVLDRAGKTVWRIEQDPIYREIYYRIGFGIVRRFMKLNPGVSMPDLIKISNDRLVRFARQQYLK